MKISLDWLNDYIETSLSARQIADIWSDLGFPYESIEEIDGDTVIDVEITSNRGDCLSYIGLARELAAATGKKLKLPAVELHESQKNADDLASVEIADPDLCCRYTARVIQGIKIAPSPDWVIKRLEAVGLRSVNNVVDATNYAMMETGQPPHAFDYDKICQGKIIVRKALPGERITSIDGTKCDLEPDMLIIADPKGPVAIAGVMGGLHTEVSDSTTNILLEDAYFDPVTVRTTSRRLSLPSEAAFRFERTVDAEAIEFASGRTAQLIVEWAGGTAARGVVDIFPKRKDQKQVTLRLDRLKTLLGIDIPTDKAVSILSALSFNPVQNDRTILCTVPSWRSDIYREADLIEEVARVYGFDKIPTQRKIQIEVVPPDSRQKNTQSIISCLNSCGFYETINVTFTDNSIAALFTSPDAAEHLAVKDDSRKTANLLRQTLLGSLLTVIKTNLNVGNTPCRVFEIADTFKPSGKSGSLPLEKTALAIACDTDFRQLRGTIERLIKTFDRNAAIVFTPAELSWAQPGADIVVNDCIIGQAAIVSEKVTDSFGFKNVTLSAAELDFDKLIALKSATVKITPIPRFPAIDRDLSLVVDEQTAWADIASAVNKKAPDELEDIQFVGIYRGKGIPAGKKSVTLALRFRDSDGTLTHDKVDAFQNDIVAALTKTLSAELRSA